MEGFPIAYRILNMSMSNIFIAKKWPCSLSVLGNAHVICRYVLKGVYPQSDGSLAIVDIDATKGFVDLWVHLSFAIFAISM